MNNLTEYRLHIIEAVKTNGPYSHNIISLTLRAIAKDFGTDEANKAIADFGLEELGYRPDTMKAKILLGETK